MSRPLRIGDARNVVVEITLDRDGLEWLAYKLPREDGFTKDLMRALNEVMREEEEDREYEERVGRPELRILLEGGGVCA